MRIAHVVCTYPPYRGGTGRVVETSVVGLRLRGKDAHVFVPGKPLSTDPEWLHRVPPLFAYGNAAFWPRIPKSLETFDVVHLHMPFFGGFEALLFLIIFGRFHSKLVVTYHMDAVADGWKGLVFRAYQYTLLPMMLRRADRILVSSRDYANVSVLARFPELSSRVTEHPLSVDTTRFCPSVSRGVLRKKLGISDKTMLFVGGMDTAHAFKGVPVFLQALAGLQDRSVRAVLVGEGDLRPTYMEEARRLGIEDRLRFVGGVGEEELIEWYQAADLLVFPSTSRSEAFGLVALEAMSCGCPVVASDLPGVRTVIESGQTGWLTPVSDVSRLTIVLREALSDEVQLRTFGAQARERALRLFSTTVFLDRLEDIYASL